MRNNDIFTIERHLFIKKSSNPFKWSLTHSLARQCFSALYLVTLVLCFFALLFILMAI